MLVLTRKVGESIVIGDGIVVRVLETGGRVRLGIEAPRDVAITRPDAKAAAPAPEAAAPAVAARNAAPAARVLPAADLCVRAPRLARPAAGVPAGARLE